PKWRMLFAELDAINSRIITTPACQGSDTVTVIGLWGWKALSAGTTPLPMSPLGLGCVKTLTLSLIVSFR
ncbi:MAG: hypothetical protein QF565_13805, partial [Arenicellales bacterium]|nr:hypothetical protein [Arenicellales bacterium]